VGLLVACFRPTCDSTGFDGTFADPETIELLCAIRGGDTEIVNKLLREGTNIDVRGTAGDTPLIDAVKRADFHIYESLLRHGANPNLYNDQGVSALAYVARLDDVDWLRLALENGGDTDHVDRTLKNWPLLHVATLFGGRDHVRLLLDSGADVNLQSEWGETAAFVALRKRDFPLLLLFLENGADLDTQGYFGTTLREDMQRELDARGGGDETVTLRQWLASP